MEHVSSPMHQKITFSRKYRRLDKPPFTYVALTALAIQSSPQKRLRLSEILKRICEMFPFFKTSYAGWKDSIRHNLSNNNCFILDLKDPRRTNTKGNYWRVDVEKIFEDKLRRQNTSVSRNVQAGFTYASDLQDVFFMNTGKIRRKTSIELTVSTGIMPLLLQQISDMPGETMEVFSEDEAPTIQEVIESLKSDENSSSFDLSPFRKRKSQFNQTPEIPSMPPQSLYPQYLSSFNPFSSPLFQQYIPQVKSAEPVYATFNQKPPFTTAALTIFAFMATKQDSVTGWQLAEKIRNYFPYWNERTKLCSLLLQITAALTNLPAIFSQDRLKLAHWRLNSDGLNANSVILNKIRAEDSEDIFVDNLLDVIHEFESSLSSMSPTDIFKIFMRRKSLEQNYSDDENSASTESSPSKMPRLASDSVSSMSSSQLDFHVSNSRQNLPLFRPNFLQNSLYLNYYSPYQSILPLMASRFGVPQKPPLQLQVPISPPVSKEEDKKYTRHAKPPYSYSSIVMIALLTEPSRALPLREIVRRISTLFPFFRGPYLGWKDSIRHNLSSCRSFVKRPNNSKGGSLWSFLPETVESDRLLRQNTYVARTSLDNGLRFVRDLRQRIDFATGNLTEEACEFLQKVNYQTGLEGILFEDASAAESEEAETREWKTSTTSLTEIFDIIST